MYLPVVLIDRFGWAGFIVFAIVNVLGCSAFGYVIRTREQSERSVEEHRLAMIVFSLITIAFHVFFASALFRYFAEQIVVTDGGLDWPSWMWLAAPIALYMIGLMLSFCNDRLWLILAGLVYLLSFATIWLVGFEALDVTGFSIVGMFGSTLPDSLLWLLPVLVFGFFLCPYLDMTFHRALQQSPSRHAFFIFGVTFALMLGLTVQIWFVGSTTPWLMVLMLAHIVCQMTFTVGIHLREVRERLRSQSLLMKFGVLATPLLAMLALPIAELLTRAYITTATDLYVRFFVFYGLIFPAYVLLFMRTRKHLAQRTRNLILAGVVVVAMMPFFELGFIHELYWMLGIPMAMVVLWLLLPRRLFGSRVLDD